LNNLFSDRRTETADETDPDEEKREADAKERGKQRTGG
jgi:hypothetical protein